MTSWSDQHSPRVVVALVGAIAHAVFDTAVIVCTDHRQGTHGTLFISYFQPVVPRGMSTVAAGEASRLRCATCRAHAFTETCMDQRCNEPAKGRVETAATTVAEGYPLGGRNQTRVVVAPAWGKCVATRVRGKLCLMPRKLAALHVATDPALEQGTYCCSL